MKKTIIFLTLVLSMTLSNTINSQEAMLGEVRIFAGNFAPRGWAFCEGQILSISQNTALFSLIGCTYGGDCRTTFALPDLRGRVATGVGNGPGLQSIIWGQRGGLDFKSLNHNQLPTHTHSAISTTSQPSHVLLSTTPAVNETPAAGDVPAAAQFGSGLSGTKVKAFGPPTNTVNGQTLNSSQTITVQSAGASQSFDNRQPFLGVRYIIATVGIFPSRS